MSPHTLLDTRELPWEDNPGIPGGKMRVLARASEGWPSVILNWLPPGIGEGAEPHRHYHRTVREHGLVLHGELPMVEFESLEAERGAAVLFREGYCMDRSPGSVHGLDPRFTSQIGFTILEWRTGTGTYLTEEGACEESIVLPAPAEVDELAPSGRPGVVVDGPALRLLDTRELPGEELDEWPGARIQRVALGADGSTTAAIVQLAPGAADPSSAICADAARAYVLEGQIVLGSGRVLRAGCYVEPVLGTCVAGATGGRVLRF